MTTSAKICGWLDCGSAVSTQQTARRTKPVHYLNSSCFQSKYSLRECVLIKDTETDSRLEMTCSVTFTRLVNGTDLCSGRLEVKPYQSWSSVCGDGFDQQDAEVVCRELGCGAPSAFHVGLYGEKAPVWMEEFQCNGNESGLLDCRRLVGEAHRCAGELEMKKQGEWRPVVDYISTLNLESAATVCRELGCGSAVSTEETITYLDRPVWWINNLLAQPNISLSPTDGDSKAEQWLVQVLMGSNFTITCSTEPQHQGGTFQLVFTASNRAQNHTLPAVNHSAHFLFYAADHTYQGDYRCVYHIHLFSYNFSSGSPVLYVAVSELIIRSAVLLLSMMLLITALCIASKVLYTSYTMYLSSDFISDKTGPVYCHVCRSAAEGRAQLLGRRQSPVILVLVVPATTTRSSCNPEETERSHNHSICWGRGQRHADIRVSSISVSGETARSRVPHRLDQTKYERRRGLRRARCTSRT
ncbi:hypothetical protein INR49_015103 [Caranx melampygus]|nr:hypothetical protein INR49_015103 [Caranx melampygus]